MKLLVDSGSTKADWIAIDDNGKVLFTTQTLGLNPEVLDKEEIINRLDDKFDISHNKDKATHLFFYGAGCGTDRMKDFLTLVFQEYFTTPIYEKKVVYKDGDKIYICFRDNEKFLEKFNQNFYKDLKRKILISIRSKLIRNKKFKLKCYILTFYFFF